MKRQIFFALATYALPNSKERPEGFPESHRRINPPGEPVPLIADHEYRAGGLDVVMHDQLLGRVVAVPMLDGVDAGLIESESFFVFHVVGDYRVVTFSSDRNR